ncbi:hypothetical protein BC829DRAFT_51822 [Chytridium lagenaria]|nr:hypothetical protein BC829DRAFT_51822 [Chytridium lagenaria]
MVTDTFDRLIWNPGDMGNEEQDIPDDWNYLPASDEKSSGRATVGVYFAHRLPALDDVRGRGGELRRIMSALRRKKRVGPPLDSYYQPSGLTHEELARVREYVGKVAHQRRILNEDEQGFGTLTTLSLRDWERTNEGRDPIWNPRTFSVSRFITDYVSMYWKMYGYDSMEDTIDAFEIVQRQQLTEMTEKLEQEKAAAKEAKHVNLEFDGEDKDGKQTDSSKLPRSRAASVIKPKRQASTFRGSRFNLSSSRKASTSSLYQLNKKKSYDVTRRSAILTGDDNVLHRASEIQAAPLTDPWRYHHSDCVNILKKPGWQRTSEEIRVVAKIMRNLSAFRGYSDFIIGQVSGSLRYQYVDANRVIIKQGDVASAWYIILSGSETCRSPVQEELRTASTLKPYTTGESFGDIALVNNETRAATVVTVDPCELVKIEKSEYDRVLKFIHEKEKTAMVNFLRFLDMFEDWKYSQLRTIAQTMNFRRILPGALIIEEGKHCSEFMLIREALSPFSKTLARPGGDVKLKSLFMGLETMFAKKVYYLTVLQTNAPASH